VDDDEFREQSAWEIHVPDTGDDRQQGGLPLVPQPLAVTRQAAGEPLVVMPQTLAEVQHDAPALPMPAVRRRDPSQTPEIASPAPKRSPSAARQLKQVRETLEQVVVPRREQSTSNRAGAAVDQLPRQAETNPTPPYPPDAYAQRQQGRVLLEVHIDERGLVEEIRVWQSSSVACLDKAALDTARSWRFEPARRGGQPVPIVVTVPIRFSIRGLE